MKSAQRTLTNEVDFSIIRYAQCWEDTDVVLQGLNIQPDDTCLSIASAGDNSLSLLTKNPKKVIAIDLSPAQIAALELRVQAYRHLSYPELLKLLGFRPSLERLELYSQLRPYLSRQSQRLWDTIPDAIVNGIGTAGKFERYLQIIRRYLLPLTHTTEQLKQLFCPKTLNQRHRFYASSWNNWRWRLLLKIFCSRRIMALLGRDPSFFNYVEGSVADRILHRVKYAMTELEPANNQYLHWICFGNYHTGLPHAFREENFITIRDQLDRFEWHQTELKQFLSRQPDGSIDRFNMSNIFEYLPQADSDEIMADIARVGRSGGRIAYWNMMVPRSSPESLRNRLRPLPELSDQLHRKALTFFYGAFKVEELI